MRCVYREFYRSDTTLCVSMEVINLTLAKATSDSLIEVRELIGDRPTIKGIQLTTREYFTPKVLIPWVSDELIRQMELLRDSFNNDENK